MFLHVFTNFMKINSMLPIRPEDVQTEKTLDKDTIQILNGLISNNFKGNSSSFSLKEFINHLCFDDVCQDVYIPENYDIHVCTKLYPKIKTIYETYGWNVEMKIGEGPVYFYFTKK
jgi:hypothetical protein